jgi:hypothetical protein
MKEKLVNEREIEGRDTGEARNERPKNKPSIEGAKPKR